MNDITLKFYRIQARRHRIVPRRDPGFGRFSVIEVGHSEEGSAVHFFYSSFSLIARPLPFNATAIKKKTFFATFRTLHTKLIPF